MVGPIGRGAFVCEAPAFSSQRVCLGVEAGPPGLTGVRVGVEADHVPADVPLNLDEPVDDGLEVGCINVGSDLDPQAGCDSGSSRCVRIEAVSGEECLAFQDGGRGEEFGAGVGVDGLAAKPLKSPRLGRDWRAETF